MQYRISAVAAIHEKALRLKSNDSSSAGHVVNLASNDCERFLLATAFGSYIIWAPLLSIVILVLGCVGIGWSFVAGFGLLVFLFIPMQLFLSKKFSTLRSSISMITDKRVTLTSQAASGVRVMKMQGWENNFEDRIAAIRAKETDQIQLVNWYRARNEALFFVANIVSAAVIFAVHVGSGGTLTSRNVFSTLVLLNLAQIELTKCLSLGVMVSLPCLSRGSYIVYMHIDLTTVLLLLSDPGSDRSQSFSWSHSTFSPNSRAQNRSASYQC